MTIYFFYLFIVMNTPLGLANQVVSPAQLKKNLLQVYQPQRYTFFCNQPFSEDGKIQSTPCPQCPTLLTPVRWIPIVPLKQLAADLSCFREQICIDRKGRRFKGLPCCKKLNEKYQQMSTDLHNFVPENPVYSQQRSTYAFGVLADLPPAGCHLVIDKKKKIVEPPIHTRGQIARTYLYMRARYRLNFSSEMLILFQRWHSQYPATEQERMRNERIYKQQGNQNPYL